jgi:hypothetical protein
MSFFHNHVAIFFKFMAAKKASLAWTIFLSPLMLSIANHASPASPQTLSLLL